VIDRRDFLLLKIKDDAPLELSCERLFMRSLDAEADGTIDRLFEGLARELDGARAVRLTGVEWLEHGGLESRIAPLLARFTAAGGRITFP
jgi:hypothetical protein